MGAMPCAASCDPEAALLASSLGGEGRRKKENSSEDRLDHLTMHIGQPKTAAIVLISQALVIKAKEVQHRRVEIVNADSILDGAVAELVGRAVADSRAN